MNIFDLALMELAPGLCYTGDIETKQDFETKCYRIVDSKLSHSPSDFGCTWEELQTKIDQLQAEWDAQEYARNRKEEYDALNQFEMQFDDKENGTTTWDDAVNAIKAKYPKPE